jgi:hypothetical protein
MVPKSDATSNDHKVLGIGPGLVIQCLIAKLNKKNIDDLFLFKTCKNDVFVF